MAAASDEDLLSVVGETPAVCRLFPFASGEAAFPLGAVAQEAFAVLGGEDVTFHDSGADAADGYVFEVVRVRHDVNVADLGAAAQLADVERCVPVVIAYVVDLPACPSGERCSPAA